MKLAFTIVILACWSKLSIASDGYVDIASEFIDHMDESKLYCHRNILSVNFSNSVIMQIGRDFMSSQLVNCIDLSNNHIEMIADGAFSELPRLTELYLSNNKLIRSQDLFSLGGHEKLKTLVLNNAVQFSSRFDIKIPGSYPNLEILLVHKNGFRDIIASTPTPFPKLKTLDLSGNNMQNTSFVNILPISLKNLYLQDNLLTSLQFVESANNITTLTLDNNKFTYLGNYSSNPTSIGSYIALWLYNLSNLRYLSLAGNDIRTIESAAFTTPINLVYLNLSNNYISTLYPDTFAKLQSLKTLDLSRNQLKKILEISAVLFEITTLSLSCNNIQSVSENAFEQMSSLRELLLDGNQIEEIDVNGFAHLIYLEKLDLSNNKLSSLPEDWTNAFTSLQLLDLSANQFTSLESLSLSNKLSLVEVYLAMNPLKYLNASSFDNLPKNVTVDLAHKLHENVERC